MLRGQHGKVKHTCCVGSCIGGMVTSLVMSLVSIVATFGNQAMCSQNACNMDMSTMLLILSVRRRLCVQAHLSMRRVLYWLHGAVIRASDCEAIKFSARHVP